MCPWLQLQVMEKRKAKLYTEYIKSAFQEGLNNQKFNLV